MKTVILILSLIPLCALCQDTKDASIRVPPEVIRVPPEVIEKYKEAGMSSKVELKRHNALKLKLLKQRYTFLKSQRDDALGGPDQKKIMIDEAKQAVDTFDQTGKESFIRQKMPMRAPQVGDIGILPFESFKVKQVVDANNLIVEFNHQFPTVRNVGSDVLPSTRGEMVVYRSQSTDAWFTIPGAGETCIDGNTYKTSDVFYVSGVKQYKTVLQSSRTILHFVSVSDDFFR